MTRTSQALLHNLVQDLDHSFQVVHNQGALNGHLQVGDYLRQDLRVFEAHVFLKQKAENPQEVDVQVQSPLVFEDLLHGLNVLRQVLVQLNRLVDFEVLQRVVSLRADLIVLEQVNNQMVEML